MEVRGTWICFWRTYVAVLSVKRRCLFSRLGGYRKEIGTVCILVSLRDEGREICEGI
jgi:hypothetical protein